MVFAFLAIRQSIVISFVETTDHEINIVLFLFFVPKFLDAVLCGAEQILGCCLDIHVSPFVDYSVIKGHG